MCILCVCVRIFISIAIEHTHTRAYIPTEKSGFMYTTHTHTQSPELERGRKVFPNWLKMENWICYVSILDSKNKRRHAFGRAARSPKALCTQSHTHNSSPPSSSAPLHCHQHFLVVALPKRKRYIDYTASFGRYKCVPCLCSSTHLCVFHFNNIDVNVCR